MSFNLPKITKDYLIKRVRSLSMGISAAMNFKTYLEKDSLKSRLINSEFIDISNETYETDCYTYPTYFECSRDMDKMVKFKVNKIEEDMFEIETKEESLQLFNNTTLDSSDIRTLQHDLPLSLIREVFSKDESLSDFYKSEHDEFDSYSPDLIHKGDYDLIFELGTTFGSLDKMYKRKFMKYRIPIENRSSKFAIFIIIINQWGVYTNLNKITQSFVDNLVFYYRLALSIQSKCANLGFVKYEDDLQLLKLKIGKFDLSNIIQVNDSLSCSKDDLSYKGLSFKEEIVVKAGYDLFMEKKNDPKTNEDHLNDFKNRIRSFGVLKRHVKPIVSLPGLIFTEEAQGNQFDLIKARNTILQSTEAEVVLWQELIQKIDIDSMMEEDDIDIETLIEEPIEASEIPPLKMRRYKTKEYEVRLAEKVNISLALKGYKGKKYRNDPEIRQHRQETQMSYDLETDVSDIEDFVFNKNLYRSLSYPCYTFSGTQSFHEYMNEVKPKTFTRFSNFSKTRIGHLCCFISSLASELNVNLRKSTKGWIVTRSRVYPYIIAMHNTGSSKHSFFTIMVRKEHVTDIGLPFNHMIDAGEYLVSPLRSTREHDLSSWLGCFSKQFSRTYLFREIFANSFENYDNFEFIPELLSTLLIELENKQNTSSTLQNVRYMYMELVDGGNYPKPFKVLSKFPDFIRSRLLVWFFKNIEYVFKTSKIVHVLDQSNEDDFKEDYQYDDDDEEELVEKSQDRICSLKSICSRSEIKYYEVALNLSYLGIYHTKEKEVDAHSVLKIFDKICSEELKLRDLDDKTLKTKDIKTKEDLLNLKSHEYSPSYVHLISREASKKLLERCPNIEENIYQRLYDVTYEELATFKASADSEMFRENVDCLFETHEWKKRPKCMESVLKIMRSNERFSRVFIDIQRLIDELMSQGGIRANLFKKAQIGGVREIIVLTILSRIVIKFTETVSRVICENMPNEFLTKGESKSETVHNHYRQLYLNSRNTEEFLTVTDSSDMTTWCQRFIMPMFISAVSELPIGDSLKSIMISTLNLVTAKKFELPNLLLEIFMKPFESRSENSIQELKSQFLNQSKNHDLVDPGSVFLKNRSNMMQGILHYTSSMIHSFHLEHMKGVIHQVLNKVSPVKLSYILTTTMCSSDDAGRITTVRMPIIDDPEIRKKQTLRVKRLLRLTSYILKASYPLIGAKMSEEKSTIGVMTGVYEFNSMWYYRNTTLNPCIKWSRAVTDYKFSTSTKDKQLIDINLLNDIIENGSSIMTQSAHEISAMLNHYDCIGLYSLPKNLSSQLFDLMNLCKHNLGYFYLLSPEKIGTALGYNFVKYFNLKTFRETRLSENYSRKKFLMMDYSQGDFDIDVKLHMGADKRYRQFLKRINAPSIEELNDYFEKNPDLLFRKSEDQLESKYLIYAKSLGSSASKSFQFETSSKQHAASSYIYKERCMTVRMGQRIYKMNLPSLCNMLLGSSEEYQLSKADYPDLDFYDDLLETFSTTFVSHYENKRRRIKFSSVIPNQVDFAPTSLKSVIKFFWFGMQVKEMTPSLKYSFRKYKSIIPWLEDTFESTLSNLKKMGVNVMQLMEFVKNYDSKRTRVTLMHRGSVRHGRYESMFLSLASIYDVNSRLRLVDMVSKRAKFQSLKNASTELYFVSTAPPMKKLQLQSALNILKETTSEDIDITCPASLTNIYIASWLSKLGPEGYLDEEQSSRLNEYLVQKYKGPLLWFKQAQKKRKTSTGFSWYGYGILFVFYRKLKVVLEMENDVMIRITANNERLFTKNFSIIRKIIKKDLGIVKVKNGNSDYRVQISDKSVSVNMIEGCNLYFDSELPISMPLKYAFKLDLDEDSFVTVKLSPLSKDSQEDRDQISFRIIPRKEVILKERTKIAGPRTQYAQMFFDSWMSEEECDRDLASAMYSFSLDKHLTKLIEWIDSSFKARIFETRRSPFKKNRTSKLLDDEYFMGEVDAADELMPENESNDFDDFEGMFDMGLDEDVDIKELINNLYSDDDETIKEEMTVESMFNFDNENSESLALTIKSVTDIFKLQDYKVKKTTKFCPFWDDVIHDIERLSETNIRNMEWLPDLSGISIVKERLYTHLLMLLDLKEKPGQQDNASKMLESMGDEDFW